MTSRAHPVPRAGLTIEELRRFAGQWIAYSPDGSRVIAAAHDLLRLDELIRSAGEDPELVGLERIELDDYSFGGAELS